MSDYDDWLNEHLGAHVRYQIALDPGVAQRYRSAGLGGKGLTTESTGGLTTEPASDGHLGARPEAASALHADFTGSPVTLVVEFVEAEFAAYVTEGLPSEVAAHLGAAVTAAITAEFTESGAGALAPADLRNECRMVVQDSIAGFIDSARRSASTSTQT